MQGCDNMTGPYGVRKGIDKSMAECYIESALFEMNTLFADPLVHLDGRDFCQFGGVSR